MRPASRARAQIRVDVSANYVGEQSKPEEGHYAFSYTITIRNEGQVPARLLTRHWVITDANGKVKEVRGEGVVGEQPVPAARPGLPVLKRRRARNAGRRMQGSYQMLADDGAHFDAPIAPFTLAMPGCCTKTRIASLSMTSGHLRHRRHPGLLRRSSRRCSTAALRSCTRPLWLTGDLVNRGPRSLDVARTRQEPRRGSHHRPRQSRSASARGGACAPRAAQAAGHARSDLSKLPIATSC
jgi:ApaG protein